MKKSILAIALLLLVASAIVHAEQIQIQPVAAAVSSTAKCQIILGSDVDVTSRESYDRLPLCETNAAHDQELASDGLVIAVSSTAQCQIGLGPKDTTTTSEPDYRYSSLPFCDTDQPRKEITEGIFIRNIANDGSVIS